MLRRFLSLFRCAHEELIRQRRSDGSYHVLCSRCGYTRPFIERTAEELQAMQAHAIPQAKARKVQADQKVASFRRQP